MSPHIHPPHSAHLLEGRCSSHWLAPFCQHAKLRAHETAVITGDSSITFSELETLSNRIANRLLAHTSHSHIGVGLHRSSDLLPTLLGILKAGSAYIPLDPTYPQQRLSQMLSSADLKTVITTQEHAACFPGATLLFPETSSPELKTPPPPRAPGLPVYAIFTSGSTGTPKAASVFDSGFENLLQWYINELALGPDDRTLVINSPSFDLTQKNLFAPLLTGGTLVLDDCRTYDITRILGLIETHGITLINCTPSAFYPLVDAAAAHDFRAISTLRFAVLGGEPISIPRLRAWLEHPACRAEVVNSYGPTECTDICLFHRLHRGNLDSFPFVPLGREIPNVHVTIRDEVLAILPDGETGELCITGAGVGAGYLNDPQRTADTFIRGVYRTGDLAKRLPCGTFEFRGRADHQVKVNGFRIELGEIEIALANHESVSEAVVTAHDNRLTAHIQGSATDSELRAFLATRLPAYMIPATFLFPASLPLTPNGKIDRKALAEPHHTSGPESHSATSLESQILALWSDIIGHPATDPAANFFDIGGTSIHLAVAHVRLREMTGRDFPITDLFAHTSSRALACHLSSQTASHTADSAQSRAHLAKTSFSRFKRPLNR